MDLSDQQRSIVEAMCRLENFGHSIEEIAEEAGLSFLLAGRLLREMERLDPSPVMREVDRGRGEAVWCLTPTGLDTLEV